MAALSLCSGKDVHGLVFSGKRSVMKSHGIGLVLVFILAFVFVLVFLLTSVLVLVIVSASVLVLMLALAKVLMQVLAER